MDDLRALNNKQLALFLILNCEPGAVGRPAHRNISPVSLHRHAHRFCLSRGDIKHLDIEVAVGCASPFHRDRHGSQSLTVGTEVYLREELTLRRDTAAVVAADPRVHKRRIRALKKRPLSRAQSESTPAEAPRLLDFLPAFPPCCPPCSTV